MGHGEPVDNEIYERLAGTWWAEDGLLHAMGELLNPARFQYFRSVMRQTLDPDSTRLRVLDLGCGGGSLAERFAVLDCRVTGIDRSARSLAAASQHARARDLPVTYVNGRGECLPFADGTLDAVVCADVLEHVDDVPKLVGEAARVLRPGGLFLYETVNRTWLSRLLVIKILQDWPLTRLLPRNTHEYDGFPRPAELRSTLAARGIENHEVVGLWPRASAWRIAACALSLRLGWISHADAARRLAFGRSGITAVSFMGYGVKATPKTS